MMDENQKHWVRVRTLPAWDRKDLHVWLIPIGESNGVGDSADERWLSEAEKVRASRFHFERDRVRYRRSHRALRFLLGGYLGVSGEKIEFEVGERGKPRLAGGMGLEGLEFNLSHSGDWGLVGLSGRGELGVDIEAHRDGLADLEIAKRYFSEEEVGSLMALPESERKLGFFQGWTRKEAYIKARGDGLFCELDGFTVELRPGKEAGLIAVRGNPEEAGAWKMSGLPVPEGYSGALVARRGDGEVRLWTYDGAME